MPNTPTIEDIIAGSISCDWCREIVDILDILDGLDKLLADIVTDEVLERGAVVAETDLESAETRIFNPYEGDHEH